jgi:hypothetical protein
MDGRELRYRLNPDGTWILYSVGENSLDDGGDPQPPSKQLSGVLHFVRALDTVWPQPASEEEIARQEEQTRNRNPTRVPMGGAQMMKRYGLVPKE